MSEHQPLFRKPESGGWMTRRQKISYAAGAAAAIGTVELIDNFTHFNFSLKSGLGALAAVIASNLVNKLSRS